MKICAKFDLFPDNTILGSNFNHSNFDFVSDTGLSLFVNQTAGENSIGVKTGVTINFIRPVNNVYFRVGIWSGKPIEVTGFDASAAIKNRVTVNGNNQYIDSLLVGSEMTSVKFYSLGLEECLVSICIEFD